MRFRGVETMEEEWNVKDIPEITAPPTILDANNVSRGGYTWTKSDLHRSLTESKDVNEKRRLLRSLLSNPGIGMARPSRKRKRVCSAIEENENDSNPLLPAVVKEYIGIGTCNGNGRQPTIEMDRITQDLHTDLVEIASSRSKTQLLCDLIDVPSHLSETKKNINSQSKNGAFGEKNDVMLFFGQPSSCIKLAYASQLYDRFIQLHLHPSDSTSKGDKLCEGQLILKKLHSLAVLDLQMCEVFFLTLIEPIRRGTLTMIKENQKYASWIEFILAQSIDPLHHHLSEKSLNILQTAVVDCLNSLTSNSSKVKIWELPPAILITISKLYFPIARTCIELLMEIAIDTFEKIPSYVVRKAQNQNDDYLLREQPLNTEYNSPMKVFDACTHLLKVMTTICPKLKSLYLKMRCDSLALETIL